MKNSENTSETIEKLEKLIAEDKKSTYILRLYIAGNTSRSAQAIVNIHDICESHLKGRYQLEVIDIYQQPSLAKGEQIIAVPTLIKYLPLPLKRIIGDMSKTERVIFGMDLRKTEEDKTQQTDSES